MYHYNVKWQSGFTLIELLIVMVILSITLALVIPFTVQQVDKERQRTERQKILLFLERAQQQAFFTSDEVTLRFSGKGITTKVADEDIVLTLDYVSFIQEQTFVFNPGYQQEQLELAAVINENTWTLQLANEKTRWFIAN